VLLRLTITHTTRPSPIADDPSSLVQITLTETLLTATIITERAEFDLSSRGASIYISLNPFPASLPFSFLEDDTERQQVAFVVDNTESHRQNRTRRGNWLCLLACLLLAPF
jgi:hypothetical protein